MANTHSTVIQKTISALINALSAITKLVNNALDNGMSWAAKNTIPGYITSRQTISVKVKDINYNLTEEIIPAKETPR